MEATSSDEQRLQANPRGKKKGEKFKCASSFLVPP